jgi:hypothetical protein
VNVQIEKREEKSLRKFFAIFYFDFGGEKARLAA